MIDMIHTHVSLLTGLSVTAGLLVMLLVCRLLGARDSTLPRDRVQVRNWDSGSLPFWSPR